MDVVGNRTWFGIVDFHARQTPDREALADESGASLSFAQLVQHSRSLATGLRQRSLPRGSRVLVYMDNGFDHVIVVMGLHRAGCVVVTCSTKLKPDEVQFQAVHADVQAIITDAQHLAVALEVAKTHPALVVAATNEDGAWDKLADLYGCEPQGLGAEVRPDDLATIMYTSGTTARPKGVLLSHGNYVFNGEVMRCLYGYNPSDIGLSLFPFFHANGAMYQMTNWLMAGAKIVIADKFSASRFPDQIVQHGITVASLNATHVKMILGRTSSTPVANSLRFVKTALMLEDADRIEFERKFGTSLRKSYSSTETIAPVTYCPENAPTGVEHGLNFIGLPTLGYRVRVVDEDDNELAPGIPGEMVVQSVSPFGVCAGYLDDQESTTRAWRNGWWHTQDVGVVDEQGYFYFVDRVKHMIKRAGMNIAAAEVERVLTDHPAVDEAAVIGVPDEVREEAICAFVVTSSGHNASADSLYEHCSRLLADYKVPGEIIFIDQLPRDGLGKVDKKLLGRSLNR